MADNGPTRPSGIIEEWVEYGGIKRHSSPFGSPSTIDGTLRGRLKNLLDRGLVARKSAMYSATDLGLEYLRTVVGTEEALGGDEKQPSFGRWPRNKRRRVREHLRDLLLDMDAFDPLAPCDDLLEEMGYQNVEVRRRLIGGVEA